MWEVALWGDVLTVNGNKVYHTDQVFNEAIVIPENIDAIRPTQVTEGVRTVMPYSNGMLAYPIIE